MDELIQIIGRNAIFFVGGAIAIVAIVFTTVSGVLKSSSRERSRREIAAYIAEGSMRPEDGERLMNAGPKEDA